MSKRIAVGVFVGLALVLLVFGAMQPVSAAFTKKAPIHIDNTGGGAQTYYQVVLNITYDSDMNNDFSDIRVKNETSGEFVPYWIENKVNGSWCKLWFNASYIPASSWCNDTYYLYYGDPSASSESDGDATFEFFDDFEGCKLNAQKLETYVFSNYNSGAFFEDYPRIDDARGLLALIELYRATSNSSYYTKIIETADHLVSLQNEDGSFTFPPTEKKEPLTADVPAIALIEAWLETNNETYKIAAEDAIDYASTFERDNGDGTYYIEDVDGNIRYNFVSWHSAAKMFVGEQTNNSSYISRAEQLMQYVLNNQNEDGSWYYLSTDTLKKTMYQVFMDVSLRRYLLAHFDSNVYNAMKKNVDYVINNQRGPNTLLLKKGDGNYASHINFWFYIACVYLYLQNGDDYYLTKGEETLNSALVRHQLWSGKILREDSPSTNDHIDTMIGFYTSAFRLKFLGHPYEDYFNLEKVGDKIWFLRTDKKISEKFSIMNNITEDNSIIVTEANAPNNSGNQIFFFSPEMTYGSWPSLVARYTSENESESYYRATVDYEYQKIKIQRIDSGSVNTLAETNCTINYDTWYKLVFQVSGTSLKASVYSLSGSLIGTLSVTDATYSQGKSGFMKYRTAYFDDFSVRKYADPEPSAQLGAEQNIGGSGPYTITLAQGYNMIGWTSTTSKTSSELCSIVPNCTWIYKKNPDGSWTTKQCGYPSGDFTVSRGFGFLAYITQECDWTRDE